MIYRIIGETDHLRWTDEDPPRLVRATGTLMGAMCADFVSAWDDLPAPSISNHRARFWFTEAGFDKYGRSTLAEAIRSGRNLAPAPTEKPAPVCSRLAG